MNKTVLTSSMILCLFFIVPLIGFNIQTVKASGTIYIRADGSVEPSDAPISSFDNITYTFTDNINNSIVVERDNIVVDGAGYTVEGHGVLFSKGIDLSGRENVTNRNMEINAFWYGIYLYGSLNNSLYRNNLTGNIYSIYLESCSYNTIYGNNNSYIWLRESSYNTILLNNLWGYIQLNFYSTHNTIFGNTITNSIWGIWINSGSNNNLVSRNNIRNNTWGVSIDKSSYNTFRSNNITNNNGRGVYLDGASYSSFYHNNFIDNVGKPIFSIDSFNDVWDSGYPSGGNYWSDYADVDSDGDGIGDTPYVIDADNHDRYPLVHPWSSLPAHNINTGLGYDTIQEAIDANETIDGYVIFVEPGTYCENVAVDKAISLIGEDKYTTIIDGNQTGGALHVRSDNVVISNFTIRNCRTFGIGSSVYVDHADHCKISNTAITNSTGGLFLFYSTNNTISGNTIDRNEFAFGVYGEEPSDFMHSIDTSNVVDGKPIYYLLNQKDIVINPITHPQVGYLALVNSVNITVENLMLTNNWQGLLFVSTNNSRIAGNSIASNIIGIHLVGSSGNILSGNHITSNGHGIGVAGPGIVLANCLVNVIIENHVSNNYIGISPFDSSNNLIYHNVFANNTRQILSHNSVDVWDNDLEGNYWNDHTNLDLDYDGIADSLYEINENNIDHYPLMGMFHYFNTSVGRLVNVVSNSSVESFEYCQPCGYIRMLVSNMTDNQTYGFCRVCVPHDLLFEPFNVTVNGANPIYWNYTLYDNGTHRWIYFAYEHSILEIIITPEFPSFLILPLFMIATLLTVIIYRRRAKSEVL